MSVRLSRAARRAQLVDLGVRAVERSSFDDLSIDDLADEAGISRSLLYHYFPSRREFEVAVAEQGLAGLLEATEPDPALPLDARLRESLAAYVDHVAARPAAFVSLVRGASSNPDLRAVVDRAHEVVAIRVLDGVGVAPEAAPPLLRVAVRGAIAFLEEAVVVWLAEVAEVAGPGTDPASRDALVALLERMVLGAVAAAGTDLAR
jgi:AcrR family transcriptional regulator